MKITLENGGTRSTVKKWGPQSVYFSVIFFKKFFGIVSTLTLTLMQAAYEERT